MIPFDQIDSRLEAIGKDRKWLAEASGRSIASIRTALAPSASENARSELLQKALSDTIEREENRASELIPDQVGLTPTADEFDAWCRAYKSSDADTLKDWAIGALNAAAEAWAKSRSNIVPISDSAQDSTRSAFPEVPLLRAVAGFPILADAEMVEPDRDLGPGRFILELRGDSMEPRFKDRQRVILRDKATLKRPVLKYGEFYCFVHEGQACFKQWAKDAAGNKVLRSLNKNHADIPANGDTDWIGWLDKADN